MSEGGAPSRRLLLVGGGHAHLAVLAMFARHPLSGAEITLVSAEESAIYSGMVPAVVAGHERPQGAEVPLAPLAARCGARFVHGEVTALDLGARVAALRGGAALPFDWLSIDIGSRPAPLARLPGAGDESVSVKPAAAFLARWEGAVAIARGGASLSLAIVGGGLGGIELALAAAHRLRAEGVAGGVRLLTREPEIAAGLPPRARACLAAALAKAGVSFRPSFEAVAFENGRLLAAGGESVPAHTVWLATGAEAAPWLRAAGLAVDARGFLLVDERLRSLSHPFVFAAGDTAAFAPHALPKSGVVAVRQGRVLADNLWASLLGGPLRPFRPQPRWLALVGEGGESAIALWGDLALRGAWAWRLKRAIDRRFVDRYR